MTIISDKSCQALYDVNDPPNMGSWGTVILGRMLCAGGAKGKDSCGVKTIINIPPPSFNFKGDSGGPLS